MCCNSASTWSKEIPAADGVYAEEVDSGKSYHARCAASDNHLDIGKDCCSLKDCRLWATINLLGSPP